MERRELTYTSLFTLPPVYDLILSCLLARSLVVFSRTCKFVYYAVAAYKSRAFNINRHFSRYFNDPVAFRCLQARTNTLVSGSNALQFLDRSYYPEADLDIYTHPGHTFEVAQFIVEAEGYHYVPQEGDGDDRQDWKDVIRKDWDGTQLRVLEHMNRGYPEDGVGGVWTFQKTSAKQELKLQIIEARSSPVESILNFHSTCVMNFISSDAAYSLYPVATLEERKSLCMPPGRRSPTPIQKYVERGWRIYFIPTPDEVADKTKSPFMLDKVRWVGDRHTWVLPLDQAGIQERPPLSRSSAPIRFDPVRCNGWELILGNRLESDGYEVYSSRLQSTLFRYNYAMPWSVLCNIRTWAYKQGQLCHEHLLKADWTWYDGDLPAFLQKESVSL